MSLSILFLRIRKTNIVSQKERGCPKSFGQSFFHVLCLQLQIHGEAKSHIDKIG